VWLTEQSWHAFTTVTFREPRARHLAISVLSAVQKAMESTDKDTHGFVGTELHLSTALHAHGVIRWHRRGKGDVDLDTLRTILWRKLHKQFGRSQVVAPRSQMDVAGYVSKYITKGLTDYVVW